MVISLRLYLIEVYIYFGSCFANVNTYFIINTFIFI